MEIHGYNYEFFTAKVLFLFNIFYIAHTINNKYNTMMEMHNNNNNKCCLCEIRWRNHLQLRDKHRKILTCITYRFIIVVGLLLPVQLFKCRHSNSYNSSCLTFLHSFLVCVFVGLLVVRCEEIFTLLITMEN